MAILKRGLAGEPVKVLQQKLGVPTDGEFGPGTEAALKKYQQENGLTVDGVDETGSGKGAGQQVADGAAGERPVLVADVTLEQQRRRR